jgi:hypothetical protein
MDALPAEQLISIASLWKSTGRTLVTSFSGASMRPTIEPGERVSLRCTDDVKQGDVAAVVSGSDLIVHRVVALSTNPRWLLLRGDANFLCDRPIMRDDAIVGVIESLERDGVFVPPAAAPASTLACFATATTVFFMRMSPLVASRLIQFSVTVRRMLLRSYAALRSRPNPN